jgi:hypothetical protein
LILNYFTKQKPRLIWVVQTEIYSSNLNKMKSYFCSNPDRPSQIQQPMLLLPYSADKNRGSGRVAPWPAVKELGIGPRCTNFLSKSSYLI